MRDQYSNSLWQKSVNCARTGESACPTTRQKERGSALILFSIMLLLVILPMIGLAIDGGVAYYAHARLVSAADAAALAGARSLNIGLDLASQTASAQTIATQYFNANYPANFLNSKNVTITPPEVKETGTHTRTVNVSVSADVSMYFLGLLGHPTTHITASAQTSRRDVNVVLTLDRSGSMGRVCGTMKASAQSFVSKFTNGRDTMGLITFMGNANVDYHSTLSFDSQTPSLSTTLGTLNCGGDTGSAAALTLAHSQIMSLAEPGAFNVIVFFTDGVPNGFSAGPAPGGFPVKATSACNGGKPLPGFIADDGGVYKPNPVAINVTSMPKSACFGNMSYAANNFQYIPETDANGNSARGYKSLPAGSIAFTTANSDAASWNAADDAALKIRQDGIFLYTIGLDGNGGIDSYFLARIANDPTSAAYQASQPAGMYAYAGNAGQLAAAFNSIASEVLRISQ